MNMEAKMDRLILLVEHLADEMQDMRSEYNEFREETNKNFDLLRGQIGSVAEALNTSNALHEAHFAELERRDAELERVQNQHSIDIMKLRAM